MGIPYYFKRIADKYPHVLKKIPTQCDRFFIDFNACIHGCSNRLKTRNKTVQESPTKSQFEKALIQDVCKYLDKLITDMNPQELVYIAIDGIPPFAKTIQQHKRRFNTKFTKKHYLEDLKKTDTEEGIIKLIEGEWDSNAISPGTVFMENLSKAITKHIAKYNIKTTKTTKTKTASPSKSLKVILSDSSEWGEGEHKIFEYIRNNSVNKGTKLPKKAVDVIHGLDADLIMLSLVNLEKSNHEIFLMREKNDDMNEYLYINDLHDVLYKYLEQAFIENPITTSSNLVSRTEIDKQSKQNKDEKSLSATMDLLIYNYVFICVLVGNDFLPHVTYIKLQSGFQDRESRENDKSGNNGLDVLLKAFVKVSSKIGGNFVELLTDEEEIKANSDNKYRINFDAFQQLFELLSPVEDTKMKDMHDYYKTKWQYRHKKKIDKSTTMEDLDMIYRYYPIIYKEKVDLFNDTDPWRFVYYNELFDRKGETNTTIQRDSCVSYIEGLTWFVDYYFNQKLTSKGWYYPYDFSPTIMDLQNFITGNKDTLHQTIRKNLTNNKYKKNVITDTIVQLVCILPKSSSHLVIERNAKLKKIYDDIETGMVHFFPDDYDVKRFMKFQLWECSPKVPSINVTKAQSAIKKLLT